MASPSSSSVDNSLLTSHSFRKEEIRHMEMFCKMQFPNTRQNNLPLEEEALKELGEKQLKKCKLLSELYKNGSKNAAVDKHKADYFRNLAGLPPENNSGILTTANTYWLASKYNHIRIFIIRLSLLLNSLINKTFLPKFFSFAGLLYGPMFLVDVGIVLKTTFSTSKTDYEDAFKKKYGYWSLLKQRFKNAIEKDERISRMFNAGFWFTINVLTFSALAAFTILSAPVTTFLIAAASGVDLIHLATVNAVALYRHNSYLRSLNNRLSAATDALKQFPEETSGGEVNREKLDAQKKVIKLKFMIVQQKQAIHSLKKNMAFDFIKTTIILTGIAMLFFPPTLIAGIALTALGIGLSAGKFSYDIKQYISAKHKKPQTKDTAIQVDTEDLNKYSTKNTKDILFALGGEAPNLPENTSPILPQKESVKTLMQEVVSNRKDDQVIITDPISSSCRKDEGEIIPETPGIPISVR